MKKNIIFMYFYVFLNTFLLFRSCDTLYYLEKGISSSNYIFFVVITYSVGLLFEIPSGIFADKFSKKKILLTSNFLLLISIILFIIANNYLILMIAIIIIALQSTFNTGIVNTIIFNSIENKEKFSKYLFYKSFFLYSSYLIAMILGGYVGSKSLVSMYYISLIPILLNFIFILLIDESKFITNNTETKKNILKDAFINVKNNKLGIYMFLSYSMIGAILTIVAESHPEYSSNLGISTFVIGIYTAIMCLFHIIGEFLSSSIKNKKMILYVVPALVGIDTFVIGFLNNKYGIVFIIIAQFLFAIFSNAMYSTLHNSISSKSRVTVESLLSLVISIFGIILGLMATLIMKQFSVSNSYIILGILMFTYAILLLIIKSTKKN